MAQTPKMMKNNKYNRHIVFRQIHYSYNRYNRYYSFYKYIIATVLKRCKLYGQTDYMETPNTGTVRGGGRLTYAMVADGGTYKGHRGLVAEEARSAWG
jgi:hypothetical protein